GPGAIRSRPRRSGRPMQRRSTGPSWGRNAHGYKGKRPRPVSSSGWSVSFPPPYRLFPSAEKLPCSLRLLRLSSSPASAPSALGNWMASPKTPTQSTGAQEEAAARQSPHSGSSQSTPAAGEALSVKSPNGRMEHGQDDSGGGRQVQVDAHVHLQPVAGGAPSHAVPAQQRRL
ncbi:hypothetical protein CFC21_031618, partial [Triticum aestivum]